MRFCWPLKQTGGRARIMHTECSGGSWAPVWADNFVWDLRHLFVGAVNNRAEGSLKWNLILDQKHGPALGGCLVLNCTSQLYFCRAE